MNDEHVMNVSYKADIFQSVWVSCLFVPVVILYGHGLIWVGNLLEMAEQIPWIKALNEILGYSWGAFLLLGVTYAAKRSKNDFIAGPIEVLNLYTFFFLGMLKGGWGIGLLYIILYIVLEVYGMPLIDSSISKNESEKARRLGVPRAYFRMFHYIFLPMATVFSAVSVHLIFGDFIPTAAIANNLDMAAQIRSMTIFVALWKAAEYLMTSIVHRSMPRPSCMVFFFLAALILSVTQLNIDNSATVLWYSMFIVGGWVLTLMSLVHNLRTTPPLQGLDQ